MPKKCSAPECNRGYGKYSEEGTSLHYFPSKEKEPKLFDKWKNVLPWATKS
ncbi:Hypothetical protein FKW44_023506 [Caligus rogercresseyi]|uniref:THAP-type domain-containing protein n=1 Tax=Caligus rogercresseyi TaxID=217165 RepID=A0A7T8GP36_CALRO|nr:Hypothetical protein FKW44_023506 [Caligus rogercresseyi]